jgi:hypothetical protein
MVLPFVFSVARKDNSESDFKDRNKGCQQSIHSHPQTCVISKGRVYRVAGVWTIPRTTQKVTSHGVWKQIAEAGPLGRGFCFTYSKAWSSGKIKISFVHRA